MCGIEEERINTHKKISLVGIFMSVLMVMAVLVIILDRFIDADRLIEYIALTYIYVAVFFLFPLDERLNRNRFERFQFGKMVDLYIQGLVGLLLIVSSYYVFMADPDSLEPLFWICAASFALFQGMDFARTLIELWHNGGVKDMPGKVRQYKSSLALHLILYMNIIIGVYSLYDAERTFFMQDLKIPKEIAVSQLPYNNNRGLLPHTTVITDEGLIREIILQMEGRKVTNIRNIERINYLKRQDKEYGYYMLMPKYSDSGKRKLENGYFEYMYIYNDNYAAVAEFRDKPIMFKDYLWRYKVNLAQDTIEKIIAKSE
jgi:hypothetical protein